MPTGKAVVKKEVKVSEAAEKRLWVKINPERRFLSPKNMLEAFFEYGKEVCQGNNQVPTHAGFAGYCGISKRKLDDYRKVSEEFEEAYQYVTAIIENSWLQEGVRNSYIASVMQTYVNNNCGYTYGKQEISQTVDLRADISKLQKGELVKRISEFMKNHQDDPDFIELVGEAPEG